MPTGPRVPEIMPPKMADVSPLDRLALGITPGLVLDRLAAKGKYPRSVVTYLTLEHGQSTFIQGHADRFPSLGLIRVNPSESRGKVYLTPL